MQNMTRRTAFAAFAAGLIAPVVAMAQATVGPAGGVPSTTAPSNSQGTPAGGTGIISSTPVPQGARPAPASPMTPAAGGDMNASDTKPTTTRRRTRRRTTHHTAAKPTTAQ